tara:strand:- start:86 stop:508 length:423 start_codon:yes stop_codon:yes gene_type:complete
MKLRNIYLISEEKSDEFKSAVAIVKHRDKWLLGLSTANDQRKNKWAFPGGGIKRGESPQKAAVRECFEEIGVKCTAVGEPITLRGHNNVAFVACRLNNNKNKYVLNSEFSAAGLFTRSELRTLKLHSNVMTLLDRVRNKY